jgi:FlaA1/EpsC-like NDP-sugar epimerase
MGAVMATLGFVAVRYRGRLLSELAVRWLAVRGVAQAQERALIIGGGESGKFVSWWLQNSSVGNTFRIAGYVDDDPYIQDARIHRVNVIGRTDDIPSLVKQYDAGIIFFAIHNIPEAEKQRLLKICQSTQAQVVNIPDVLGNLRQSVHDIAHGNSPQEVSQKIEI